MTEQLPAGEKLPEYDDGPADGADLERMLQWLTEHRGWIVPGIDRAVIREVLAALQAVGGATLVKNETYRAMRRDGTDVERLAAYLTREGYAGPLIEHDGNPVTTIIAVIGTGG